MSGKIRIIGGQWRGRRLTVPRLEGLRPTGDRARETLFNWLLPRLPGSAVLDLFAGTGALGLEALSRGAASAVFVERDRALARALGDIACEWPGGDRMEVVCAEALAWLVRDERRFDLVFLDPPFSAGLTQQVLESLVSGGHLADGACVYVERDARAASLALAGRFEVLKEKTLGEVRMSLLSPVAAASEAL